MVSLYTQKNENPFALFQNWFEQAQKSETSDANAMSLATCNKEGKPSCRIVLLKDIIGEDFIFYTNLDSRKGLELRENPFAALTFYWKSLEKQVRIEGAISFVEATLSDSYFHSRPRESQIGAWASSQSRELESGEELLEKVAFYTQKFADKKEIPRPLYWGGVRLTPECIEFWQAGEFRLHERLLFVKNNEGWASKNLYP